jgi:hypothetical protein
MRRSQGLAINGVKTAPAPAVARNFACSARGRRIICPHAPIAPGPRGAAAIVAATITDGQEVSPLACPGVRNPPESPGVLAAPRGLDGPGHLQSLRPAPRASRKRIQTTAAGSTSPGNCPSPPLSSGTSRSIPQTTHLDTHFSHLIGGVVDASPHAREGWGVGSNPAQKGGPQCPGLKPHSRRAQARPNGHNRRKP